MEIFGVLSFFLLSSFIGVYNHIPKDKEQKNKRALGIMFISTTLYSFWAFTQSSFHNNIFDKYMKMAFFPLIISIFITSYILNNRLKTGINKIPKFLVISIIVTFSVYMFFKNKQQENEKIFREYFKKDYEKEEKLYKKYHPDKSFNDYTPLELIEITVKETKELLPIEIEKGLILYDVSYNKNENVYAFFYRLKNVLKKDLTDKEIIKAENGWEEYANNVLDKYNNDVFEKENVTFQFVLKDVDFEQIFSYKISTK